jgi:hypothetical protein
MHMIKRMTNLTAVALAAVLALGAGVVLAQDIKTNYVPGTDFSKYRTYKWVEIEKAQKPDDIVDGQIRAAIDAALAGKGLTKAAGEAADLFVGYQIAVNQERQWNAYGGGGLRWGGGMGTATSSTISIGTLVLDMYDPATKSLVWKGSATKTLNPSDNPEKNQDRMNKAMAKLLKDFPPKAKNK